ncbi:MAG: class C sortase [Acidobacteriota bacterium]|nr:class C sortase [Acidobacteriota bacterium]
MNTTGRHVEPTKRRWKFPTLISVGTLIILLGVAVVLYPTTSSWFSQYNQSKLIDNVSVEQENLGPTEADQRISEASEYNRLLVGGAIVEANQHKATGSVEDEGEYNYFDLLNADQSGAMGRLRINSIDVDLPIYHGTSDKTLTKGVGHLRGTALPVPGFSQRPVLTAHRGYPEATLFDNLDKVKEGDTFVIEVFGQSWTYKIYETKVIDPEDTESISIEEGRDIVSLLTCTPLGINTHRILVTGERIDPTPIEDVEQAGAPSTLPHFPWWIVVAVAALIGAVAIIWHAGYREAERAEKRAKVHVKENTDDLE